MEERQRGLEMQRLRNRMGDARLTETEVVDIIIANMQLTYHEESLLRGTDTITELKNRCLRYRMRLNDSTARRAKQPPQSNQARGPGPSTWRPTQQPAAGGSSQVRCFNCDNFGHYKGDCTMELRPPGICWNCWKTGHKTKECPPGTPKYIQKKKSAVGGMVAVADAAEPEVDWNDPGTIQRG